MHTHTSYMCCLFNSHRASLKAAVFLLPILGLTWIFGLLAINQETVAFAWIFTILNSLQVCTPYQIATRFYHCTHII